MVVKFLLVNGLLQAFMFVIGFMSGLMAADGNFSTALGVGVAAFVVMFSIQVFSMLLVTQSTQKRFAKKEQRLIDYSEETGLPLPLLNRILNETERVKRTQRKPTADETVVEAVVLSLEDTHPVTPTQVTDLLAHMKVK